MTPSRPAALLLMLCALATPLAAQELPARGTVEALFTPWDDAEGALLRAIGAARGDIHVQAFLFTSRTLGRALLAAQRRGIRVRVLADRGMVEQGGKFAHSRTGGCRDRGERRNPLCFRPQ